MKKVPLFLSLFLVFNLLPIFSAINDGKIPFTYELSTILNKDGNTIKTKTQYWYSDKTSATLMLKKSINSNLDFTTTPFAVLNYTKRNIYEVSLTPYNYHKTLNNKSHSFGVGLYYGHDKLSEEGFIYLPTLAAENKAFNIFSNNLTIQSIGPIINIGTKNDLKNLKYNINLGIVPIFYYFSNQEMSIDPLMNPTASSFTKNQLGYPYVFIETSLGIWDLIKIQANYQVSRVSYELVDFSYDSISGDYIWGKKEETQLSNQINLALSINIPKLATIGGGLIYSNGFVDSQKIYESTKYYFVFNIGG